MQNNKRRTPKRTRTFSEVQEGKENLMRVLFGLWGFGCLLFTGFYSANGFGSFFEGDAVLQSFGFFLAFGVIIFQLYFYQGYTENLLMLILAGMAFIYSIWTTWIGLMGTDTNWLYVQSNVTESSIKLGVAMLIDLTAEPSLLFSYYGKEGLRASDSIGRLIDLVLPGDQSNMWRKREFPTANKKRRTPVNRASKSYNSVPIVHNQLHNQVHNQQNDSKRTAELQRKLRNM